jgi:hypothetical protein
LNIWLLSLISGIILTASNFAVAETMSFQNHNFTIEVPPTWTAINPAPPGTLFAMQSSNGEKVFFANALSVPENKNASEGLSMMVAGFKKARIDNNYRIVAERQQTLNNFSFTVFTSQASDKKRLKRLGLPPRRLKFIYSEAFIKLVTQTLTKNCCLSSAASTSFHPLKPLVILTK